MYSYSEEIDVNLLSLEEKDGINLVEKLVLNPRIAHKRSQGIDKILEKELKDSAIPSTKVLILGSGDSGKSTFVRHMRISYFKTFTLEELGYFKFVIHGNIISVLKKLAEKLELLRNSNDEFKFSPGSEGNQPCDKKHFQILQQFVLKKDLPPEIVTAIQMIWNDENIKSCYEQRRQLNLEIQETAA
ncbi:Guanine nucleotide-binding protein subunit alpha-12 [Lobulomyces angularis]|nr:Guanine nucleotide-binding protein subunit alpha-12 [Lobulomyces angularis]